MFSDKAQLRVLEAYRSVCDAAPRSLFAAETVDSGDRDEMATESAPRPAMRAILVRRHRQASATGGIVRCECAGYFSSD